MTLLNRTECSVLRGIAILGIFLHNFLHWLGPMVKENEYQFIQRNVDRLMSLFGEPSADLPLQLFSFFGHYGVPVFLFLSGYGLVKKYEKGGVEEKVWAFLKSHFMKLFPMMLLGFVAFAMVDWMTPGRHHWTWIDILAQLTMTINLLPDPDHIIWPGPYWYFGLTMQVYVVYRLLLYKRHWGWTAALMVLCTIIQMLCFAEPEGDAINRIRYNCIGGMLPFGIGLLLARFEDKLRLTIGNRTVMATVFMVSLLAVMSFSLNFWTWLFVPAFIVALHIAFVKLLPQFLLRPLDWLGVLSSAIFVCHPITRKIFIPISRGGAVLDGLVLYIVATIVLALLFQRLLKKQ